MKLEIYSTYQPTYAPSISIILA